MDSPSRIWRKLSVLDCCIRLRTLPPSLASTGVPVEKFAAALAIVQTFQPPGVGARDLSECLRLQLEGTGRKDTLEYQIVTSHMESLGRRRFPEIARALTQDVDHAGFAAQQGVALAGLVGLALVHLAVALLLSPPLTALALGCGVAVALVLRPLNRRAHQAGKDGQQCRAEMSAAIAEHLAGFKVAKGHGRGGHHLDLFRRATHAIAAHSVAARHIFSATRVFFELAGWVALMAFLYARRLAATSGSPYGRLDFRSYFPVFIAGFILMATARSLGDAGLQAGGPAFGLWSPDAWQCRVERTENQSVTDKVQDAPDDKNRQPRGNAFFHRVSPDSEMHL